VLCPQDSVSFPIGATANKHAMDGPLESAVLHARQLTAVKFCRSPRSVPNKGSMKKSVQICWLRSVHRSVLAQICLDMHIYHIGCTIVGYD